MSNNGEMIIKKSSYDRYIQAPQWSFSQIFKQTWVSSESFKYNKLIPLDNKFQKLRMLMSLNAVQTVMIGVLTWCLVVVTVVRKCCLSSSRMAILWLAASNCSCRSVSWLCDLSRSFLSSWKSSVCTAFCCFKTATSSSFSSSCFISSVFTSSSLCFSRNAYNEIHKQQAVLTTTW